MLFLLPLMFSISVVLIQLVCRAPPCKMSRHMSSVMDIKLGIRKRWTVLVQVVENNGHIHKSISGTSEFKRLVLTDSEGTKFNALIYKGHMRFFAYLLVPYKRYYISNAVVLECDARYRISAYECSWVLNNRTLVEEFVESVPMTLPCQFDFTSFDDLHKYAESENSLNVKAIVLHCFPTQEHGSDVSSRRDIVIVNEDKKLLLLTLWNEFDKKEGNTLANMVESGPVIFGMRLKVTTFNSLSLSTRGSSGLMVNPPVAEALRMKDWYNENKEELQELLEKKSYKNTDLLLPYPKEEEIISLAEVSSSLNTLKPTWVKGKTIFPRQERLCWYTACANCQKSLEADVTWVVTCPSCKQESEVEVMSRITIVIDDGTGRIRASICSPDAEEIMSFTAMELKQADEDGIDLHDEIVKSVQQQTIVAFIRSYESMLHGQPRKNIIVVKAYKTSENGLPMKVDESESTLQVVTIAQSCKGKDEVVNPSNVPNCVKRSLPFSTKDPCNETVGTPTKAAGTVFAIKKEVGAADKETGESPNKKTKESST